MFSGPALLASALTWAAFRSCVGVMRVRPSARYASALNEFAALKLKSPMQSDPLQRIEHAGGSHQDRAFEDFQKIHDARSPGFKTRGLATRAVIPADFTRSTEGRRPYRSR